jgi:1,4-dihydroxy-2-naphthoate octaprenyltransferase
MLVLRGGWPIALIAVLSVLCGIFYTAGPYPLGYLGLGDILVFIFFGPVAVMGTYYVQSFEMNFGVFMAGVSAGCFSTAILAVNNLRDIDTDRAAGKRTLAVRFGRVFAQGEYFCLVVLGSLAPVFLFLVIGDHRGILWCPLVVLLALPAVHAVFTHTDGPALNKALAQTGVLLLIFTVIFALGWMR